MAPRTIITTTTTTDAATAAATAATEYYNGAQLAERGWTPAMIRDFLGSPDHTESIPGFGNVAPMLQFAASRVEAAESTPKFEHRKELAIRRSEASRKAAARRREEMLRVVAADEIPIPRLPADVLTDRAVRHSEPRDTVEAADADRDTLNRWKVNYLRHELIRFDETIEGLFGQVGRAAAEKLLRRRALESIGNTYPDLLFECQRQMQVSEQRC